MIQVISEKTLCSKGFTSNMKIIVNIIPTDLVTNWLFILFFVLSYKPKQESGFQQVGGLVTRNISVFYLQPVAFYFKAILTSVDFYKGIFLYVIPVRIIFPCLYLQNINVKNIKNASRKHSIKTQHCSNAQLLLTTESASESYV